MPAIGSGVGDVHGEGKGLPPVVLRGLAIGDHGEEVGLPPYGHGGIAGKVQPGHAGDAVEVGRLARPGLDAVVAAVLGHVGQEGLVEGGEVLIVRRPEVGEGVVILVKHGVVGVEHVVVTRVARPVHPHPEGGVGQDVVGHAPDKAGVEF